MQIVSKCCQSIYIYSMFQIPSDDHDLSTGWPEKGKVGSGVPVCSVIGTEAQSRASTRADVIICVMYTNLLVGRTELNDTVHSEF